MWGPHACGWVDGVESNLPTSPGAFHSFTVWVRSTFLIFFFFNLIFNFDEIKSLTTTTTTVAWFLLFWLLLLLGCVMMQLRKLQLVYVHVFIEHYVRHICHVMQPKKKKFNNDCKLSYLIKDGASRIIEPRHLV